jgi:hypothetical protein
LFGVPCQPIHRFHRHANNSPPAPPNAPPCRNARTPATIAPDPNCASGKSLPLISKSPKQKTKLKTAAPVDPRKMYAKIYRVRGKKSITTPAQQHQNQNPVIKYTTIPVTEHLKAATYYQR